MSQQLASNLRTKLPTLLNNSVNKSIQRSISTTPAKMSLFRPFFNEPFFSTPSHFGYPTHVPSNGERESRQSDYHDLMENFFKPSGRNTFNGPPMDLIEESNRYCLTSELPGVKKQDVQISVDDRLHKLTISGTTKRETTFGLDSDTKAQSQSGDANKSTQTSNSNETQVQKPGGNQEVTSTKNHRPLLSERVFGSFSRSFTFPDQADLTKIKAHFQDGLLKLEIPKSNVSQPKLRTVTIEDGGE